MFKSILGNLEHIYGALLKFFNSMQAQLSTSKPYWEHYQSSPHRACCSVSSSLTIENREYALLGRSPSGFFILCMDKQNWGLSVWGLRLCDAQSDASDLLSLEYFWELIEDCVFDVSQYVVCGVLFDEYKVPDVSFPELTVCVLMKRSNSEGYSYLTYVVNWVHTCIEQRSSRKNFIDCIQEGDSDDENYHWIVRLRDLIDDQRQKLLDCCGVDYDFVWFKSSQTEAEESIPWTPQKLAKKRGRPQGSKDNCKRLRTHNLNSRVHHDGKVTLLKILILTQDIQKWSISAEVCYLFVLSEAYANWFEEKGIDSMYKRLYDWMALTRDAALDSHLFTRPFTEEFFGGWGAERKKQLVAIHAHFREWYEQGAPSHSIFASNLVQGVLPTECKQDQFWFARNRKRLLDLGKFRLIKLKDMHSRIKLTPSRMTLSHYQAEIGNLQREVEMGLRCKVDSALNKAEVDYVFSRVDDLLKKAAQYGESMERLIFVLQTLRRERKEIAEGMNVLTKELSTSELGKELMKDTLSSMLPNALEHIKNTGDQRLISMFPPHISHSIIDLIAQSFHYPSMTTVSMSMVPHIRRQDTPTSDAPVEN